MDVHAWYAKFGGTFIYCQAGLCRRRFRTWRAFRRHFDREHADRLR